MQKLDFTKHLDHIIQELSSRKIVEIFEQGFANPGAPFNFAPINPLLFASKSKFDDLNRSEIYSSILEKINASEIYEEANLAFLTTRLRNVQGTQLVADPKVSRFYSFHKSLVGLSKISNKLLVKEQLSGDLDSLMESGYLIFQVVVEEEGLEPSQYSKILSTLDELIKAVEKIIRPEDEEPAKVILLDSGSDTNLGIKASAETVKSLFLIFKEIWDFITNYRFYKSKQKNEVLIESLTIRKEILKMKEEGVLSEEEAKQYTHLIKSRADSLIGMKVLPKSLMNTNQQIENKNLLNEYKDLKLLG